VYAAVTLSWELRTTATAANGINSGIACIHRGSRSQGTNSAMRTTTGIRTSPIRSPVVGQSGKRRR
jgi:hypothetical protein